LIKKLVCSQLFAWRFFQQGKAHTNLSSFFALFSRSPLLHTVIILYLSLFLFSTRNVFIKNTKKAG
jgi:uncharacterized membrane protein